MEQVLKLECPKCRLPARAVIESPYYRFIVYTCPKCYSNVVYYKNKIDVIPDRLFKKLLKKRKLAFCGDVVFNSSTKKNLGQEITQDDILNLKILLETEMDSARVIPLL
jgi:endogenous inhibitor of DNA gyrase (YacG/DUF329 family)